MMDGLLDGKVRAFYIFGENMANTEPDIHHVEKCLSSAEFLVCQDIFPTETTRFAHVIFPAAAWSENDGTFTNSERRVSRVRTVSQPPGAGQAELVDLQGDRKAHGTRLGIRQRARSCGTTRYPCLPRQWRASSTTVSRGTACNGRCRLRTTRAPRSCTRTAASPAGSGRFAPVDWTPPAEVPDEEYPFVLSTGRRLYHYHTRTQTGRAPGLNKLLSEETADMSPEDAESYGDCGRRDDPRQVAARRGARQGQSNRPGAPRAWYGWPSISAKPARTG